MADVTTTFAAKDEGFAATMTRMQARLAAFTKSMTGVQAASAKMSGGFSTMTKSVIGLGAAYLGASTAISAFNKSLDLAGRMKDLSTITGEGAGNLAVLERAFNNTDIGGEKMLPMLTKMNEFIQKLSAGNKENKEAVSTANALGISLASLQGKTPVERFKLFMQAIGGLTNENDALTHSVDVFGTKLGAKTIPLARSFTEEINEARAELGSLPDILNKNAEALEKLGDKLTQGIGNKLSELALGFIAGTRGATEMADAISKIDAAGAGLNLGQMFSGAIQDPLKAFVAIGEVLLLGVKKAGNFLINATMHAVRVYADALTSMKLWEGVGNLLSSAIGQVANFLTRAFLSAIKKGIFEPLAGLPSWLGGDIYAGLLRQFEKVQGFFDQEAAMNAEMFSKGASQIAQQLSDSITNIPKTERDYLGAANQEQEVSGALNALRQLGITTDSAAQTTRQKTQTDQQAQSQTQQTLMSSEDLQRSYNTQAQSLRDQKLSSQEHMKQIKSLNAWMYAQLSKLQGQNTPPAKQMKDATISDSSRKEIATLASSATASNAESKTFATETTLQKAVRFLEELNTKLPQPILV